MNVGKAPIALPRLRAELGLSLVAASGLWRDAMPVTGSAAALGIVPGPLIRRREAAQRI
jgi:hypothetical protein